VIDKLQLVPIAYLNAARNRAHGRTAGGKLDQTWTESAGKSDGNRAIHRSAAELPDRSNPQLRLQLRPPEQGRGRRLSQPPQKSFLRVFCRFRSTATRDPREPCFIRGRQESAAGTSSLGIAVTGQKS
jgi:hypothetical protein